MNLTLDEIEPFSKMSLTPPKIRWILLDPTNVDAYLLDSPGNRHESQPWIDKLAQDRKDDKLIQNGGTLIIHKDVNRKIINGHHGLHSVKKSGLPTIFLEISEVPVDTVNVIDRNKIKSASDILSMPTSTLAVVTPKGKLKVKPSATGQAQAILAILRDKASYTASKNDLDVTSQVMNQHPEAFEWSQDVALGSKMDNAKQRAGLAGWALAHPFDPVEVEKRGNAYFYKGVSCVGLSTDDPLVRLAEVQQKMSGNSFNGNNAVGFTFQVVNAIFASINGEKWAKGQRNGRTLLINDFDDKVILAKIQTKWS